MEPQLNQQQNDCNFYTIKIIIIVCFNKSQPSPLIYIYVSDIFQGLMYILMTV